MKRPLALLLLALALALLGQAAAHATLVIGELVLSPDPPVPGESVQVTVSLVDPLLVEVEKALVRVELRDIDPDDPEVPASVTGSEAVEFLAIPALLATDFMDEIDPGVYAGSFEAPAEGRYTLSVRDTTFRNEEAIANLGVEFGAAANGDVPFVLPPTPIAPSSLLTWLVWIIGIPVAVGLVVTFLVLRRADPEEEGGQGGEEREEAEDDDPGAAGII